MSNTTNIFIEKVSSEQLPWNIEEVMLDEYWKLTLYDEMKALQDNNTWELTALPDEKKTIGYKKPYQ